MSTIDESQPKARAPSRHRVCRSSGALILCGLACEPSKRPPPPDAAPAAPEAAVSSGVAGGRASDPTEPRHRWSPHPETAEAITKIRTRQWKAFPQSSMPQRLAFFANNLAFVAADGVTVVPIAEARVPNPCRPHHLAELVPRELTTLADQTLLVIGARRTLVIDSNCETTRELPKVSYIPGNRLWQEPRWPNAFSLFDSATGSVSRFRWDNESKGANGILLPESTYEDPNVRSGICTPLPDASLACARDNRLFAGWPGHSVHEVGHVEPGGTVVRLLPAERADHVRVLRDDATVEEYWLAKPAHQMRGYNLPSVPFDVAVGRGLIAVLQVEAPRPGLNEIRLVVLDSGGALRWVKSLGRTTDELTEEQTNREYFECRSLAVHPVRPWIAVSNCQHVELYHAKTGQLIQRMARAAF